MSEKIKNDFLTFLFELERLNKIFNFKNIDIILDFWKGSTSIDRVVRLRLKPNFTNLSFEEFKKVNKIAEDFGWNCSFEDGKFKFILNADIYGNLQD